MENLKEVKATRVNGRLMSSGKVKSLNEKRREQGVNIMKQEQVVEVKEERIDTSMFDKLSANKAAYNKHLEDLSYDRWLDEQFEQEDKEKKLSYKISKLFKMMARDLQGKKIR